MEARAAWRQRRKEAERLRDDPGAGVQSRGRAGVRCGVSGENRRPRRGSRRRRRGSGRPGGGRSLPGPTWRTRSSGRRSAAPFSEGSGGGRGGGAVGGRGTDSRRGGHHGRSDHARGRGGRQRGLHRPGDEGPAGQDHARCLSRHLVSRAGAPGGAYGRPAARHGAGQGEPSWTGIRGSFRKWVRGWIFSTPREGPPGPRRGRCGSGSPPRRCGKWTAKLSYGWSGTAGSSPRAVEAGPVSGGFREIRSGLSGGELLLTGGVDEPKAGMRVKTE